MDVINRNFKEESDMVKPLKLGIIGAGNISKSHLEAARRTGAAVPVAICDPLLDRANQRQNEYGIQEVYADYHDMLAKSDIEAVVVCPPNHLHHVVTIDALRAGKHVLCEKPMSFRVDWAQSMVDEAKKSGKILQVGMVSRYQPTVQWLRRQVAEGSLGWVYFARAQYVRRSGIPGWGSWFTRKDMAGGGPLIDIGVHRLDLAWYLMGCPKPVSVFGVTFAALGPSKQGLGTWGTPEWDGYYDVEDFSAALITFADGSAISLEAVWADYTDPSSALHLIGNKQGAQLIDDKVKIMTQVDKHDMDTMVSMPKNSLESGFSGQMMAFRNAVRGEAPCPAPGEQGLEVTKMLAGIYESAQKGASVAL